MRSRIVFAVLGVMLASSARTQTSITLLTFESYTFPDKFDTEYGEGKLQGGFQWGGGLEFGLNEFVAVELIYQNLKADVYYEGFDNIGTGTARYDGSAGINYAMLGVTRYAPVNDRISGFGTFDLGVGWLNPDESLQSDDIVKFAIGGRLGVRMMASDKVSLRLHAQLFSPVQWGGGGVYFGSGGPGAGVSTGSTIWQFNLGGSLNYKLK